MSQQNDYDLLADLVARAKSAGADAADAMLSESVSASVSWRLGKPEDVERAEGRDVGLRVFIGRQQAFTSSSDTSAEALAELVERGIAMAKAVPEDPYCGLADPALLTDRAEIDRLTAELDLLDGAEPSTEDLIALARVAEEAALAVEGVTNSDGAGASFGAGRVALATSHGFVGGYRGTQYSLSVSAIAGTGQAMERDHDYDAVRHLRNLDPAEQIGRNAGERAVARLKPRKVGSAKVPVVFDRRVAGSLLGHLAGAINGQSVARGTSFLKDRLGARIFAPGITIADDPLRPRGLRSRPFDGEGVRGEARDFVADGVLTSWVLDSASARQLGLRTTGHAARGAGGPPSPSLTNLALMPGRSSVAELLEEVGEGLYVTELIGMGVNPVTGDYSRGAGGFWIEGGRKAYPVSEITVAGNLKDMFLSLTPADDLERKRGIDSPTVRVDGMTVAGT
ncbi:MAG: TldD/PmbA family protein [Sneathiellaceae bacterium]